MNKLTKSELKTLNSMVNNKIKDLKNDGFKKTFRRIDDEGIFAILLTALLSRKFGRFIYVDSIIDNIFFRFYLKLRVVGLAIKNKLFTIFLILIITGGLFTLLYSSKYFAITDTIVLTSLSFIFLVLISLQVYLYNVYANLINGQNDIKVEEEMNLTIGDESKEVMLSSELAIYNINHYSNEVVLRMAYEPEIESKKSIEFANEVFNEFAQGFHLKNLIDARGRCFQVAGIISALISAFNFTLIKIEKSNPSDKELSMYAKNAVDKYLNEPNCSKIKDYKDFLEILTKESTFDMELLENSDISELLIIPLLCKDKLSSLKETYHKFDVI